MLSQLHWFKSSIEINDGDRKIIRSLSSLDYDGLGAFSCLPNEILVKIFSFLSPSDNCRVSLTSKRIQNICEDDKVWKSCFRRTNWHKALCNSQNDEIELSWKDKFKAQYTLPSEFEARFLDLERRRDCLIDMKYVKLKKLERKFKVQQERLYRAIGGFVLLIYLTIIYTSYRVLAPMLSLSFLREEIEEESINKIVDLLESCLTVVYLVFIAWIANRPAYRIYDQLINVFATKEIAKNLPLFDVNKFRKKQERIEQKYDPQIEYLNEQLKKMKRTDAFQCSNQMFFFKLNGALSLLPQ